MAIGISIFILVVVILIYFQRRKENERKKKELQEKVDSVNQLISNLIPSLQEANEKFSHLTSFQHGYFSNYDLLSWKRNFESLHHSLKSIDLSLPGLSQNNTRQITRFLDSFKYADSKRKEYNDQFIANELKVYEDFFKNIEGRELDIQQKTAVVTDEDNNIVIAGAGSGKTTTIAGKVAYLLKRYNIQPQEILLISFTNKACEEMKDRIKSKMGIDLEVKTFHKLGLEIIAEASNEKPTVFNLGKKETSEIFSQLFKNLMEDGAYLALVTKFFTEYLKPYKEENEFKSEGERSQYLKDQNLFGLKKVKLSDGTTYRERLKSQEEVEIANFLFLHDIEYTYEEKYEYRTASKKFGQYKPDFKIENKLNKNGKGIYIEHFAIDRFGNVPDWFKGDDNQNAQQKYNSGISWKRQLHTEKGTTLIETYSHERKENKLILNLKEKLTKTGIQVRERSPEEIWKAFEINADEEISNFIQLVQTFLSLMKSNNYTFYALEEKAKHIDEAEKKERAIAFLKIFKPIWESYESLLKKKNEIDFSDMINTATRYVKSSGFENTFKYILIDEFQDISIGRYSLVKALKESNPGCKLFCVGDDWQSIYRFSGSDIAIFTEFEKYFGVTAKSYIEKTYRFNDKLIDVSSEFILKNPKQFKKGLKSDKQGNDLPFTIFTYSYNSVKINIPAQKTIEDIIVKIGGDFENNSILILGRYNHDIKTLAEFKELFDIKWSDKLERTIVTYKPEPRLKISFLSVHGAKGLQAEYVILLNANSGKYGFPSEISDDPLLDLVLTDADQFPNGEERRLFYVALTRTKNHVYIISNEDAKSKFVDELETRNKTKTDKHCPWCETGVLILREGQYGYFYGCGNFPHYCNYTQKVDGTEIFTIAEVERKAENYDAAIELYKKALKAGSHPEDLHYYLGYSLYKIKKYSECISELEHCLSKEKTSSNAYYWLGCAYQKNEKYDEAISSFSNTLLLKKDYFSANYSRGESYLKNKDYMNAIGDFSMYLSKYPDHINSLLLRGESKFLFGDKHGAWKDWKAAENIGSTTVKSFFEFYKLFEEPKRLNQNKKVANSNIEKEKAIGEAIHNSFLIKFNYQKSETFDNGEKSVRTIKPIEVVKIGVTNSPCIKGYCYLRNEERTFAIDRISDLILDPEMNDYT